MIITSTILISLFSGLIMMDETYEIENKTISNEIYKTIKIINYEISNLDSTAIDWAYWDDTYYYVINQNNDYISNNLMDDTFSTLKINFFVIIDNNGKILYKKAYDLEEEKEIYFPQSLEDEISNSELFIIDHSDAPIKGILNTKENAVF